MRMWLKKVNEEDSQDLTLTLEMDQRTATKSEIPEFWYEDNNMNVAGGYPTDIVDLFRAPEKWASLREKISIYMIRGNTLNNIIEEYGEQFVTDTMAPVLINEGIPLAIDNTHNFEYIYHLLKSSGVTIRQIVQRGNKAGFCCLN